VPAAVIPQQSLGLAQIAGEVSAGIGAHKLKVNGGRSLGPCMVNTEMGSIPAVSANGRVRTLRRIQHTNFGNVGHAELQIKSPAAHSVTLECVTGRCCPKNGTSVDLVAEA
jgi:hypothetical protein